MATLLDLPSEVLQVIISDAHSIRDIAALAVQCRRLHGLCDMTTRKKYHRIRLHIQSNLRKFTNLLLSTLRNPALGTYVRDIEFNYDRTLGELKWGEYSRIDEEDTARVYSAIRRAGFRGIEERRVAEFVLEDAKVLRIYRTGLSHRIRNVQFSYQDSPEMLKAEALAALFISVSPNLESLALCPLVKPWRGMDVMRMVEITNNDIVVPPLAELLNRINFNVVKTEALQRVRHIKFILKKGASWSSYAYDSFALLENLNLIHQLPNLESVRIVGMTEMDLCELFAVNRPFLRPCPKSTNINRIHIEFSYVRTRYLELLIDVCKRLREFTYWTGPVLDKYYSNPRQLGVIAPETLARALLSKRHSLESLDLEIDDAMADFDTEEPPIPRQPSLGGHDAESDIPIENLMGAGGFLVHFTYLTRLTLNLRLFFYFATGINPVSVGRQDRGDKNEGPQSYHPDTEGQSLQHDNNTTIHEDLEFNNTPGSKDEKYQRLVKTLPPRLEYLCILGYRRGFNEWHDFLLSGLMTDVRKGGLLPQLEVRGVWENAFRPSYTGEEEVYSAEGDGEDGLTEDI